MHVEARPREITRVALLDLTGANAEQALAGVTRIADVATILVSENLLARLSAIPMEHVATIVPVPSGGHVRVVTGQVLLSGEALAIPESDADEVLIVAGQLVAPVGSETALGAGLTRS
jgi:hypothetical protein